MGEAKKNKMLVMTWCDAKKPPPTSPLYHPEVELNGDVNIDTDTGTWG